MFNQPSVTPSYSTRKIAHKIGATRLMCFEYGYLSDIIRHTGSLLHDQDVWYFYTFDIDTDLNIKVGLGTLHHSWYLTYSTLQHSSPHYTECTLFYKPNSLQMSSSCSIPPLDGLIGTRSTTVSTTTDLVLQYRTRSWEYITWLTDAYHK